MYVNNVWVPQLGRSPHKLAETTRSVYEQPGFFPDVTPKTANLSSLQKKCMGTVPTRVQICSYVLSGVIGLIYFDSKA